ncbi:NPCBM/NEW2 domain-containing protein [Streptomyces palmae]|uniref:NPCBM/NEW2 domain-containing protein n=1 Tax=Streptomyces palmae TaxID=1701085 RepID=UPI001FD7E53F|nr:NPCBM/NEW2 domain-containing protein [Streptomyces palmae]
MYPLNSLGYDGLGDGTRPELRGAESSWMWRRWGLLIGGRFYAHGVSVAEPSSLTIDLNRACTSYSARVGMDDLGKRRDAARFAVYADGVLLWRSPVVHRGDPAVPLQVELAGRRTLRLVVERHGSVGHTALATWAESGISCA